MSNDNKISPPSRNPVLLLAGLSCGMGGTVAHFLGIDSVWGAALIIFIGFTASLFTVTLTAPRNTKNAASPAATPHDKIKLARKNLEAAIAEGLQEAIFIIDRNALITYANLAARRLFPELTLKQPLSTYVPNPAVSDLITETLDGSIGTPLSIIRPGSVDRHIRISGTPIISQKNGEDVIKRAVIILADVTEIERTNTQRADFLANASHELKTPIASMLGYIETLRGHAKDDPAAQEMFLGIMQEQAERMQRLITDILSLRKIELAEHQIPTERADFGLAAKAALEAVHPIAKMRKVKVRLSGKKKNALVMGRQDELVQLALNLVDNAVRMSPEDSRIQLEMDKIEAWVPGMEFREAPFATTAQRRGVVLPPRTDIPYWRLTVRDAGPGFKADHLPRLGERFYRIAGDRSSKEKGTGLGLAIVKHIVRWHRGGLYIESAEGKGTEFTIIIPIADDPDETHITPDPLTLERGAT
ncbi:MAG: ATP-binding protein [Maricaulaceae bacterium]